MLQEVVLKGDPSGKITEQLIGSIAQRNGLTVLPGGKFRSDNGFDHVLMSAYGIVTLLVDSKQMRNGAFRLTSEAAGGGLQLSRIWIDTVLERLPEAAAAKIAVAAAIRTNRLRLAVSGVDRASQTVVIVPLSLP